VKWLSERGDIVVGSDGVKDTSVKAKAKAKDLTAEAKTNDC